MWLTCVSSDAFIWQQPEDSSFHMLLHSMHPSKIPTTAWSPNGIDWTPAFVANQHTSKGQTYASYGHEIEMTDNTTFQLARRERHQLLLDGEGRPTHLLNGVTIGGSKADFSFTAIQPLNR